MRTHRWLLALLAIVATVSLTVVSADARMSGSSGSRGSRTFSAPSATTTAPRAAPIERTMTQPSRPGTLAGQTTRPGLLGGGLFGGGMLGGLAAGFLGAGLFGMLFGHGFLGGMGGFASFLGLLIQVALVVLVARLAWAWWQRRNQPAYASGPSMRENVSGGAPSAGGFGNFGGGGSAPPADEPIELVPADFDAFEKLLTAIQTAYGKEDLSALRLLMTPEELSYFSDELAQNASRGVVNQISDVKLLQGDLSEAWREGQDEYATVAMRYSLNDKMIDRASGQVVEDQPSEAREFWTFRRARGGAWLLSAIQQTT